MAKNFRETLADQMNDPVFRAEWEAQAPERQIMRAIVEGGEELALPQQFSEDTGLANADDSHLENGIGSPSLRTLKRPPAGQ